MIYGRTFKNPDEARGAVGQFVKLLNSEWLIKKNGYLSLRQAREAYYAREAARLKKVCNLVSRRIVALKLRTFLKLFGLSGENFPSAAYKRV